MPPFAAETLGDDCAGRPACRARCCADSATRRRRWRSWSRRSLGRAATWAIIAFSAVGSPSSGPATSPEAIASSSSCAIVGERAQRQRERADRLRDRDLLGHAAASLRSSRWNKVCTTGLPSSPTASVRWSVASTRRLRRIVSETLSGAPSPPPATLCVSTRSTRSPGKTKPATAALHRDRHGDRAHARAERGGEEAAVAGLDQRALRHRLAGGDRGAHHRPASWFTSALPSMK